jgi:Ca2+-binding EF-hand superfamily protein
VYYGCGKRSIEPNVEIGYPCNFAAYDTDNNGKIDRNEFKKALRVANSTEVWKSFKAWDKTGDGVISCGEFLGSEHEFKCQPHGCKTKF